MSAKDLEDFIKVIETAEKMSTRAQSSIWSYPTDIFTTTSSPRRITPRPTVPPNVPKLWDPKAGNDFLGSSWGSKKSSVAPPSTSSRTTIRTNKDEQTPSSTVLSSSVQSPQPSTPCHQSPGKRTAKVVDVTDNLKTLMNMQKNKSFARRVAKDLLSSMSPTNSPRPSRKTSKTSRSSASTTNTKKSSSSKSPMKSSSPATSRSPMKSSSPATSRSPEKKSGQSASSVKESETPESTSPKIKKSSSSSSVSNSPKKKSSVSSTSSVVENEPGNVKKEEAPTLKATKKGLTRSIKIVDEPKSESEAEEEPRPVPQPRSKSIAAKRSRPKSAPMVKKEKAEEPKLVDLRSYSKSLKLLGLDIPSNRKEATKVKTMNIEIKTKSPTLKTRITERTQSVNDLRQIVDSKHHMPKDEYSKIKSGLASAVFEEWYFNKMKELAEKKRGEMDKIESKIYQKELDNVEKKEKAAIEFKKWLESKQSKPKKEAKLLEQVPEDEKQEKIFKSVQEWKSKKAQEYKKTLRMKRRSQIKEEQERLKEMQKKEESSKHFLKWQETWREKMKQKLEEDKQKTLEELKKKKEDAAEQKEAAELAFKAWLQQKKELKKEAKKKPGKGQAVEDKAQRLEAAHEAYENWLEYIEQREEEEKYAEEERVLREMWRPPWYPAGIADF